MDNSANDHDGNDGSGRFDGKKIKPGDGHALKPFQFWQLIHRSLFYAPFTNADGSSQTYAINVDFFDWDEKADVYLNGKHHAVAKLPMKLPVEGGMIETATTTYGLKRMHYVTADGTAHVLQPDPGSAEGQRAKLTRSAPRLSKTIGILAVLILVCLLPFGLMQLAEMITQIEVVAQYVGEFTAPISLPEWASTPALVLGVVAALERALTLRSHWLIDMDTGWFD